MNSVLLIVLLIFGMLCWAAEYNRLKRLAWQFYDKIMNGFRVSFWWRRSHADIEEPSITVGPGHVELHLSPNASIKEEWASEWDNIGVRRVDDEGNTLLPTFDDDDDRELVGDSWGAMDEDVVEWHSLDKIVGKWWVTARWLSESGEEPPIIFIGDTSFLDLDAIKEVWEGTIDGWAVRDVDRIGEMDFTEEFEGGVHLEYTARQAMTDEQRAAFMALMPIAFEDTYSLEKGAALDIIFGEGNWACKTSPININYPVPGAVAELIVNQDFATWIDDRKPKPENWIFASDDESKGE